MEPSNPASPPTCCSSLATRSTQIADCGARSSTGGRHMRTDRIGLVLTLTFGLAASAGAQEAKKADSPAPTTGKKPSTPVAVIGADIYTVTKGVIKMGVILIQDGKILKVGADVAIPDNAIRIDAAGKIVTPGFVTVTATGVALRAAGGPGGGAG